ncbi:MAG TPA: TetR/AcrR family transcriptional regulator [Acidimicrobiales bacterium]|nr:TetR/AcrR family transcriptional regulator [Acidimicrobiales bacterium]
MAASSPRPPRPPRSARRRPDLSVEAIVTAAIAALDDEGVEALSMRSVAARLGTGAATLYGHVASKEELLELVFDELVGQVPLVEPDPASWRQQVVAAMTGLRDVLVSHRDAALAGLGRIPTSPKALAAADCLAAVLRAGGLSERTIALGLDQMVLYVTAFALELSLYEHKGLDPEEIARYFAEVHAFYEALPAERYPALAAISPEMTGPSRDERFAFGLNVLISGMEALDAGTP